MNKTLERIVGLLKDNDIKKGRQRYELAEICDISYSAVSQWYSGETKEIDYRNLKSIADRFGVTIDYLTGKDDHCVSEPPAIYEILDRVVELGGGPQAEAVLRGLQEVLEEKK